MKSLFTWFAAAVKGSAAIFLLDTTVKATVLLAAGYAAAAFLRRSSAAVRHRVWCLCFASLLLLPALPLVLPEWRLPILPGLADSPAASHIAPASVIPTPSSIPHTSIKAGKVENRPDEMQKQIAATPAVSAPADKSAPVSIGDSIARGGIAKAYFWQAIIIVWLTGTAAALLPLAASLIHNRILCKNARPATDAEGNRLMAELCRILGVRRAVRLMETEKSLVPMAWGLWRATVLVPRAWRDWPLNRRRIVLLHELAHVKRWDMGFQLLARAACAFYWFHPLAWHALRRLRIERESACDDCVLMAGERSSDYAQQLLQIARDYHTVALSAAVAMAQSTKLERRVRVLLDQAHSHLSVSRSAGRLLVVCSALLLTGVAFIGPAKTAEPAAKEKPAALAASSGPSDQSLPTKGNQMTEAEIQKPVLGRNFVIVPFTTELQRAGNWRYAEAKLYILINGKALFNDEDTVLNTAALDFEGLSKALEPYSPYHATKTFFFDSPSSSRHSQSHISASLALMCLLEDRLGRNNDTGKNFDLVVHENCRMDWTSVDAYLPEPPTEEEIRRESGVGDDLVKVYPICTPLSRYFYGGGGDLLMPGGYGENCVIRNIKPLDQFTPEEIQAFPEKAKTYIAKLDLKQIPRLRFLTSDGDSLSKAGRAYSQLHRDHDSWWKAQGFVVGGRTYWDVGRQTYKPPVLLIKVVDEKGGPVRDAKINAEYPEENKEFLPISEVVDEIGNYVTKKATVTFTRQNDSRWRSNYLLNNEDFTLTVQSPGYRPASQTLNLPKGVTKELELKLQKEIPEVK